MPRSNNNKKATRRFLACPKRKGNMNKRGGGAENHFLGSQTQTIQCSKKRK
uniref:Uncharacterized protein n=1 Tax=Rhizophora mucronata TaxID=61149 RepID=A0A2P2MFT3_RHIMU